ncbi:hypothetical protein [Kitasatospora cathayae]|uniref:RNA polymerase sigma-70 region 2 domain-containing protein n=1 Tax=Kitasatospora cathayae TaxID=3004092 RepID=A0ABY7QHN4_9ACTN|nr:hypothetical protein [Kitasatospora sp. HUAS 3-15]WBP91976.1 hypothetical protein O1G21_40000 [Kitasatospora sp. HUAS 3-15]
MTTMMALSVDTTQVSSGTIDDLYTRYSCRLLAAATERLAAISPSAVELDEDVTQDVWTHAVEYGLPDGMRGLDALLFLLDHMVARASRQRREHTAGIARPARRTADPIDLDALADTIRVAPAPARPLCPATASRAFDGLRDLPLAG